MKTLFYTKTLIALALAVAAAAAAVSQAQEQPIPPPSADSALPANIVPGSPLADVVKMVQAGVDAGTINSYILNSQSPFNLDADKIIFLKDMGVPSDLVNAMMERDKVLYASTVAPPPAPVTPMAVNTSVPDTAPPPAEVNVNYFNDTLTPYGSWVDVEGYGRCWRPTVVIYDSSWRPYCDRGHWVYTDYGWYWDSDYSWGVTFHYGRWFRSPRLGWCWYPDTVWAPSWVTWRSDNDYCGWAPLPPFADFRPGFGFFYRGTSVALNFDFGLGADCFMFVSPDHFCDRHPRSFCLAPQRVPEVFRRTTVVNNFNLNNRTIINRGISVDRITSVTHRSIEPVHVSSLPNAGRQGWRGEGYERTLQRGSANSNAGRNFNYSSVNTQLRHGPEPRNEVNNNPNANFYQNRQNAGQATQGIRQGGNQVEAFHPQVQAQPQSGGVVHGPSQGVIHEQAQTQMRPANTFTAPGRDLPQNDWRQNRNLGTSGFDGPQQHGAMQLQQRPAVAQDPPRADVHQNYVESAPHNSSPPPSGSAPAQNLSRNVNNGSSRGSDNNKPNH